MFETTSKTLMTALRDSSLDTTAALKRAFDDSTAGTPIEETCGSNDNKRDQRL